MDDFIDGRRTDNGDAFFNHAGLWIVFFATEITETTAKEYSKNSTSRFFISLCALCTLW
jgi:hypothetical protein